MLLINQLTLGKCSIISCFVGFLHHKMPKGLTSDTLSGSKSSKVLVENKIFDGFLLRYGLIFCTKIVCVDAISKNVFR